MNPTISLRPLTVRDAPAMVPVLADPALYRFTGGQPPTLEELRGRYEQHTVGRSPDGAEEWWNRVVLVGSGSSEASPEIAGYVQATIEVASDTAEIAWVIGAPWQGRAVVSIAARPLLTKLRKYGVRTVIAHVHPDHAASRRVAEHVGLRPSGVIVDGEERWTLEL